MQKPLDQDLQLEYRRSEERCALAAAASSLDPKRQARSLPLLRTSRTEWRLPDSTFFHGDIALVHLRQERARQPLQVNGSFLKLLHELVATESGRQVCTKQHLMKHLLALLPAHLQLVADDLVSVLRTCLHGFVNFLRSDVFGVKLTQ